MASSEVEESEQCVGAVSRGLLGVCHRYRYTLFMVEEVIQIDYTVSTLLNGGSTMTTLAELRKKRREIQLISAKHGIIRLRVFGSVARGEQNSQSDLDLLVGMAPSRDLTDLVSFVQDMQTALHAKVDVVSEAGLSPYLRDQILAEARSL